MIGLGCENNQVDAFRETLGAFESDRVAFMVCQQHDDEIEAGLERLHALYEKCVTIAVHRANSAS